MAPTAAVPLLETKLRPPRPRASLLDRPRLAGLAQKVLDVPLTVVSAPAGFGKSTLMVAWYHALAGQAAVCWLSIDETDSDANQFARYLAEAYRRANPGSELAGNDTPVEALAGAIVNEVSLTERPTVLMLDDYHLIASPRVDGALGFLLERAPANLHLVIGSRTDPALPLPRLRARGRLLEVRADDLRFTGEEAGELLNGAEQLGLARWQVEALEARTEGWAAALQLAALAARGASEPNQFVSSFGGSHRFVFDYLAEEVLGAQDDETQLFLLRTSILEQLSGPLCDAVTGLGGGAARLARLNRANLFTVALDDEGNWYRYHHLFRDFLRRLLEERHREEVAALHRRASEWLAAQNRVEEAVPHALASGDEAWALDLIERGMPAATLRGDILTPGFERWLQGIPREEIEARPRIALPVALSRALNGRLDGTLELVENAEQVLEGPPSGHNDLPEDERQYLRGAANLARAYVARFRGEPDNALTFVDRGAATAADPLVRAWLGMKRQLILFEEWAPGKEPSHEALEAAARNCYAAGHLAGATAMKVLEFYRLVFSGQLNEAERHIRAALTEAYERNALPALGMLHGALSELCYERGDLDEAEDEATRCAQLGAPGAAPGLFTPPEVTLARVQAADGRIETARASLELLEERARRVETVQGKCLFPVLAAQLHLLLGDVAAARRWVDSLTLPPPGARDFDSEH
ncbi:MAG: hypothetical protein ACM3S1_05610, partial [Hyphomicrobiales bacterium]